MNCQEEKINCQEESMINQYDNVLENMIKQYDNTLDNQLNKPNDSLLLINNSEENVHIELTNMEDFSQTIENKNDDLLKSKFEMTFLKNIEASVFGAVIHCQCIIHDEVKLIMWLLLLLLTIIVVCFLVADLYLHKTSIQDIKLHGKAVAISLAGVFSFAATILSIIQIKNHKKHWIHPPSQKCIIRILLMIPIYSTSAWLSLIFEHFSLYIDFIRIVYEAFVIYNFTLLLTKYLGGSTGVLEFFSHKPKVKWPAPLCCLNKISLNKKFLNYLILGTLQYTIIAPILSVIAIICDISNDYEDGAMNFKKGYPYVAFIMNCTQFVALYCLIWLYIIMKNELNPFKPMYKFIMVKSVVFLTFWQGILLAALVHFQVIIQTSGMSPGQVQVELQEFIICIEMFVAAIAHKYVFDYREYTDGKIKIIMDERALYLSNLSYNRAMTDQNI